MCDGMWTVQGSLPWRGALERGPGGVREGGGDSLWWVWQQCRYRELASCSLMTPLAMMVWRNLRWLSAICGDMVPGTQRPPRRASEGEHNKTAASTRGSGRRTHGADTRVDERAPEVRLLASSSVHTARTPVFRGPRGRVLSL